MQYNIEQINHLIRHRRTVYPELFDPERKVPDEIVWQLLENANWAPTHGLTQPWRFKVFAGAGIQQLIDFQTDLYKQVTPEDSFVQVKYDKLINRPEVASHIISIGMKRDEKIREMEEIEAVACAVQNMQLTAWAYGVGSFWSSGGITYKEEAKAYFDLGEQDKLLGFLYLGYAAKPPKDSRRGDIKEKLSWVD